jgi:hypothetical protein
VCVLFQFVGGFWRLITTCSSVFLQISGYTIVADWILPFQHGYGPVEATMADTVPSSGEAGVPAITGGRLFRRSRGSGAQATVLPGF